MENTKYKHSRHLIRPLFSKTLFKKTQLNQQIYVDTYMYVYKYIQINFSKKYDVV